MWSLLAAVAWSAPDITARGRCPGPVDIEIVDGTPGGKVAVLTAFQQGNAPLPGGPCQRYTGLSSDGLALRGTVTLDAIGAASASPTLPPELCGGWVQIVDAWTCELSPPRPLAVGPNAVDLRFYGAGYQAYGGKEMWFALYVGYHVLAYRTITVPADGRIDVRWSQVLPLDTTVVLFWAADLDGDGTCDAPPTDHGWSIPIPGQLADAEIREDRNANYDNYACNFIDP